MRRSHQTSQKNEYEKSRGKKSLSQHSFISSTRESRRGIALVLCYFILFYIQFFGSDSAFTDRVSSYSTFPGMVHEIKF